MLLRWLISTIGLAALKGEITAAASRAGKRSALYFVAAIAWLVALGFLVAALTIWLSNWLGPIAACGIIAGVLIVVGVAIQVGLAITSRRRDPPAVDPLAALGAPAAAGAAVQAAGGTLGSLALIAVIGWLLGRQATRK